jgi:sialic acid synthase SpsE
MFKIRNRQIGSNFPPLIIAELGINHNGSLKLAKEMVLSAAKSGCEIIKHQTHFVNDEMTNEAKYIHPPNANKSIWDVINSSSLSKDEEISLKNYVEELGMIYISTPFSRSAVDFLYDIGVPAFKIGSGECDNLLLIQHIASKGLPVIMSTGMQSIDSLKPSVKILEEANIPFALLECTSLYPAPPELLNLDGILQLKRAFPNIEIGFSDHSIGPYMSLASIALGATIIERHFTDSRYRSGPDISVSMDPIELSLLINKSREIWKAKNNKKMRKEKEQDVYKFARSSLVADKNLKKGKIIDISDLWARRPGNGEIPGYKYKEVVGKKLLKDLKYNDQISWKDIED